MNRFRKNMIIQFKTGLSKKIGKKWIGFYRCTRWGVPSVAISFFLFAKGQVEQELSNFWMFVLGFTGMITLFYFWGVFIHFRLFPIKEEEARELHKEGFYTIEGFLFLNLDDLFEDEGE